MMRTVLLLAVALSACAGTQSARGRDPAAVPLAGTKNTPRLSAASSRQPESLARRAELPNAPLTLDHALAIALANNPNVVAEHWEIEAAEARKRQASSEHWPSLEFLAAYRHHWHEERLAPARGQTPPSLSHDIFSGDVVLTVPLLSGGKVVSSVAAAELLADAAEQRLARTREELIFNVKSTFYAILGQEKVIEAIQQSAEALTEHRENTVRLIEAQKAAGVDLLNIDVRLAELDYRRIKQQGSVELHKRLLLGLLGAEAAPPGGMTLVGTLEPRQSAPDAVKASAAAIGNRADIAQLDLEIEAQAKRIAAIRAAYLPVVAAKGTYGSRLSIQGDYEDLGFVGVELQMPIFEGFETPARIEEQEAELSVLEQRRRRLVLTMRGEIDSAVIQVKTAQAAVAVTEKSILTARESLRITRDKAALDYGTAADVLDAQAALLQAETAHCAALADLNTAFAVLDLAAGGPS